MGRKTPEMEGRSPKHLHSSTFRVRGSIISGAGEKALEEMKCPFKEAMPREEGRGPASCARAPGTAAPSAASQGVVSERQGHREARTETESSSARQHSGSALGEFL